jgi:hypothetical protein
MLCLSYYCLCLLFNKSGEKGRTGSAWKWGAEERNGSNIGINELKKLKKTQNKPKNPNKQKKKFNLQ